VLVECGFVRATTEAGEDYTFTPSFGRLAALGSPHEIVALYAALHGPRAAQEAAYVLAGLCDQDDPTPLIGWRDADGWHAGAMPEAEQIVIARHLMQHGICGTAKPGGAKGEGKFSDHFNAAEYISAARVHLGLSSADAEALSMTEFQIMLAMKFPDMAKGDARDVPSREEYDAAMARIKGAQRG
jgi:hypothetical protein